MMADTRNETILGIRFLGPPHNMLLKSSFENYLAHPFQVYSQTLLPMPVRFKTSKHVKTKESENVTQTEKSSKAVKAIHSQDGFRSQTEESREDKSFSLGVPQASITVPDHRTQAAAGQDVPSGALLGRRL